MNLNLTCPVNSLGYGVVGLNILLALHRLGHDVSWWPIGLVDCPSDAAVALQECFNNQQFFDADAASLRLYHQFDLAQHVGGERIGFPIFELNRFKPIELHHIQSQDAIFVASAWAQNVIFENSRPGVFHYENIHVVPLGVDRSIFCPQESKQDEATVFLNIGKWEIRKGHDVLIDAFEKAFTKQDNVRLVMNCYNPCISDQKKREVYNKSWAQRYLASPMGDKIRVVSERLPSQQHVAELMASADCGVFPARAEGWNMELLEMMSMGKAVIATKYAAHTEFCTPENTWLVNIDELEEAHDGVWFDALHTDWNGNPGQWAAMGSSQVDQLVEHLRDVHRKKQSGELSINSSGIDTAKKFNWDNTADAIIRYLKISKTLS